MGTTPERRSMAMTDEEKKLTAYHSRAGHALVAMHVPKSDPLHKVTIMRAAGRLGDHHATPTARSPTTWPRPSITRRSSFAFTGGEEKFFPEGQGVHDRRGERRPGQPRRPRAA